MTAAPTILADAEAVAAELARVITEVAAAGPAVGIIVSGAPALRRAYERLAAADDDFAAVHLWYADERTVATTHPDSTHGAIARAWLDHIPAARAPIVHRIAGELGAIAAARSASAELRAHAGDHAALDLAILAVSADGSAAALVPGDPATTAGGLYFPAQGGTRVTATVELLARARRLVVSATGTALAAITARILRAPPSPDLPASVLAARVPDVRWIIDRPAAAQLG